MTLLQCGSLGRVVVAVASAAALFVACSGTNGGGAALKCYQKSADGSDSDCVAQNLPRKLDCDTSADKQVALSYGCKEEKPGDQDVCCPTTVYGGPRPDGGSSIVVGDPPTGTDDGGPVYYDAGYSDAGKDTGADASGLLGMGEPCMADSACKSGLCYRPGGTFGWCTTSCTMSFDAACFGTAAGGKNSLGEYVACMPFAGGGRCYPGCVTASCTKFTGTICNKSAKDINNYNVAVCQY